MSELRPGTVIAGRFRIERRIGAGAMAFVYEATHLELRQKVALKFLNDQFRADPDAASRFVREARAQFSLRSEHVGRVFDVARMDSGQPFIVMELLEGKSLKEELDVRERFAVRDAVEVMRQVCDGVGEAHALGIVHRDLKPGNIFVARGEGGRPNVKVIDFGLAKARDHASEGSLTAADMLIGTPRYMAPEQFAGAGSAGTHTDVWALGVVLFRLLTGELPFDGPHPLAIAARIRSEDAPSPSRLVPEVPPELSTVILKCLARDPARRYPTATALGAALAQLEGAPWFGKTGGGRAEGARGPRARAPSEDSVQELSLRDAQDGDESDVTEVAETAPVSEEAPTRVGVGVSHAVVVPAALADTSVLATTGTSETRIAAAPPPKAPPRARSVPPPPLASGPPAPTFVPASRPITPRDGVASVSLPPAIEDVEELQTRLRPALVAPHADARRGPTPAAGIPAMTQPLPPGRISAPPPFVSPMAAEAMRRTAPMPPGAMLRGPLHSDPRGVPLPPPSGSAPGFGPAPGSPGLPPALEDLWQKLLALGPLGMAAVALTVLLGLVVLGSVVADCSARPARSAGGVTSVRAPAPPPQQPTLRVIPGASPYPVVFDAGAPQRTFGR